MASDNVPGHNRGDKSFPPLRSGEPQYVLGPKDPQQLKLRGPQTHIQTAFIAHAHLGQSDVPLVTCRGG